MKELEKLLVHRVVYTVLTVALTSVAFAPLASAHSPVVDGFITDWCTGSDSYLPAALGGARVEDTSATLTCGNCSVTTDRACLVGSDCPGGETCVNLNSKSEVVWWDNRTDGAVNDLGTVAMTWDNDNLYVAAELWVDPDPVSLPFGLIAIDYAPGGADTWHDRLGALTQAGNCSISTDRACTSDADCEFCDISTEPFPSTRLRTCGSGCDLNIGDCCCSDLNPNDPEDCDPGVPACERETCVNLGDSPLDGIGECAVPGTGKADYLLVFDFGIWLTTGGSVDHMMLVEPRTGPFPPPWNETAWTPVTGCIPDDALDTDWCDSNPQVNPGASGGSGGPPGSVEVAIPWSHFGCTGCPGACVCPGMGPNTDFRFTMTIGRGEAAVDYTPRGAHEDLMSSPSTGNTTTSSNDCAGFGIGNTTCELSDGSADAWVPRLPLLPHETIAGGRTACLTVDKNSGTSITLDWAGSCSGGDNDFGIYEGVVGNWLSHIPVPSLADACTTGGGTTASFETSGGNTYYLVVPTDGNTEGSYGGDSITGERPVSATACKAQSLGTCF